jgi:hypothetical protein
VRGFPNRFDLTLTAPDLGDPGTGFGWSAPFVQVFAMTWRPWHVILAFPPEQQVLTPAGTFTLTAGKLQASLRARPVTRLPLDRLTLVGTDLGLLAPGGVSLAAPELRFATRDLDGTGLRHEIGVEVTGLAPGPELLPAGTGLPDVLDRLRLDADLTFSAPIDRTMAEVRPEVTAIDLREALLLWGDLSLRAEGALVPDAAGLAEGSLTLRVTNWQRLLPALVAAGLVRPDVVPTWTRMLEIMAQSSGDPAVIDVTLRFAQGRVSLGPLPLGPAPRLR